MPKYIVRSYYMESVEYILEAPNEDDALKIGTSRINAMTEEQFRQASTGRQLDETIVELAGEMDELTDEEEV